MIKTTRLLTAIAALSIGIAVGVSRPAQAGRNPPTTTTVKPPTTTTTIPTTIPTPANLVILQNVPSEFQVHINPSTQLGDAELLSGPTVGGPAIVTVGDGGTVAFLRLVENADYVFRYRNKIWIPSTSSFLYSPYVQFSFHTPTNDSLRPASPGNLRVVSTSSTTVTLRWDAVATATSYSFSINAGAFSLAGACGAYCTPDPLTATIARPVAGSSATFAVVATRPTTYCGPYCYPAIDAFRTSLPSTIVVQG